MQIRFPDPARRSLFPLGVLLIAFEFPQDPEAQTLLTPNEIGTRPGTLEELDFTTGPQTRLLKLALLRRFSQKFDNKLRGTVRVDDVSLIPVPQEPSGSTR